MVKQSAASPPESTSSKGLLDPPTKSPLEFLPAGFVA
jgi:hypothetical protein